MAGWMGLRLGVGGLGALLLIGPFGHRAPYGDSEPRHARPPAWPSSHTPQEVVDTIPLVPEFSLDGDLVEWRSRPPGQVLPATAAAPQALVWLGQVPAGIVVATEVRGAEPDRPDPVRFSVSLSDADPPVLPPIGWGHQFGFETLDDEAGCREMDWVDEGRDLCAQWYRSQVAHRETLQSLLARRWSVSVAGGEPVQEDLARPRFDALEPAIREKLAVLEPVGSPTARSRPIAGAEFARGLEILIPWEAFPPVRPLDLEAVILRVGWDSGTGSSPGDGDPARRRMLADPLRHRLTTCGYGLSEIALFDRPEISVRLPSEEAAVFMIPDRSLELFRLIVIDNEAHGYQYEPDSTIVSPAAFEAAYSSIELDEDESLCTPFLTYQKGGRVSGAAARTGTGEGGPWELLVDSRHLETRRLEDGDWLVKQGPRVWWSYYGSGQCGACPRVGVDLYHVEAASGRVTRALSVATVASGDGNDIEIDVSDDWLEVTVYRSSTDWDIEPPSTTWTETRYCFDDGGEAGPSGREPPTDDDSPGYEVCGEEAPVPEPPKRLRLRYAEFLEP